MVILLRPPTDDTTLEHIMDVTEVLDASGDVLAVASVELPPYYRADSTPLSSIPVFLNLLQLQFLLISQLPPLMLSSPYLRRVSLSCC